MKLLLAHRSFPGQFRWLIPVLLRQGIELKFICLEQTNWPTSGIEVIVADKISESSKDWGTACERAAYNLKKRGWEPDYIYSHQGWGVWKVKNIFQNSRSLIYCEWWYSEKSLNYFSARTSISPDCAFAESFWAINEEGLEGIKSYDIGITPTFWQKNSFPSEIRNKLMVLKDGFPSDLFSIRDQRFEKNSPIKLCYVSRGMEYTRGLDLLYSLYKLLENNEVNYELFVVADNRRVYDDPETFKRMEYMRREIINGTDRVNFSTQLAYSDYLEVVAQSDIHLYLSRPFVLSWSVIESMLIGSRIIGCNNPSLSELVSPMIGQGQNINCIFDTIKNFSSNEKLDLMRRSKYLWSKSSDGISFRNEHSLEQQCKKLIEILLG